LGNRGRKLAIKRKPGLEKVLGERKRLQIRLEIRGDEENSRGR